MVKPRRCAGGCGKTQPLTVAPKGVASKMTFSPPWTCPECKAKEERRKAAEAAKKDVTKATPGKSPEKGFTYISPQERALAKGGVSAKLPTPPPAAPPPAPPGPSGTPSGDPTASEKEGLELLEEHETAEEASPATETPTEESQVG